jgi:hypothetical protein
MEVQDSAFRVQRFLIGVGVGIGVGSSEESLPRHLADYGCKSLANAQP